ncbi:MAG TPA: toll/interleukin-1 receptor domain-containing protein [Candidatus Binatia bacterium]
MRSSIFLSYASEQSEAATHIELSLKGDGYSVFRDRTSLPPGESFDARILTAIEESDLFIFLISRDSISQGRYTLTELKFAEQKWGHPAGHVLPVLVEPVPKEAIPIFLRAVTILHPQGNVTAEVAAEVARMTAPWWRRMLQPRRLVPTAAVMLILVVAAWIGLPGYLEHREQERQAVKLEKQSQLKAESGDFTSAWKLLEQANAIAPGSSDVFEAQERLAMKLLRDAGVNYFRGNSSYFEELVNRTLPVLSRGASGAKSERLANLLAHTGWAEYLRERAGVGGLEPAERYRHALDIDPGNVYGHAMWGFEILRKRGSVAAANQHFSAALESGREHEYLRSLQISALLQTYTNVWIEDPEREKEAIRVANQMRINGETRPKGWGRDSFKGKLWRIYHFGVVTDDRLAPLLAALPPAEHLSLFRWLFPEDDLPKGDGAPSLFNFLFVLAQLEEQAGDRAGALASYRRLLSEFANKGYNSSRANKIASDANAAIKRLSS